MRRLGRGAYALRRHEREQRFTRMQVILVNLVSGITSFFTINVLSQIDLGGARVNVTRHLVELAIAIGYVQVQVPPNSH